MGVWRIRDLGFADFLHSLGFLASSAFFVSGRTTDCLPSAAEEERATGKSVTSTTN